jgi:hypothetical protein
VESVGLGIHSIFQAIAFASTTNYTFSVFVKAGTRNFVSLVEQSSGGAIRRTFFNLSTGEVGTKNASHTASTQQLPNGWWRLIISFTSGTAASANIAIELASADNVSSYLGNGSGNVFLWGAQVEAGAFPTSYIPTATTSLIRSADVCSITGGAFSGFYNQSEGSVFFSGSSAGKAASATFGDAAFYLNILSDTSNRISMFSSAGTSRVEIKNASVNQYVASRSYTNNVGTKQILGYSSGQLSSGFNDNVSMTASANITLTSPTVTSMELGRAGSGINHINGHIASIRYYRKRLTNAKLVTLTAP